MQRKKQNFIEGAMILVVASALVKIIGAFYKIPLKNIVGSEGMGLFSVAYQLYNVMLVVATVGLPVALSKMVAEAVTLGKMREVRRIVKVGAAVFVPIGAVCSVLLLAFAKPLAAAFGNGDAALAVVAIAPSVLLVAVISVFRGYYQGLSNMVPTAVSQVIEALCKLGIGLVLATLALRRGMSMPAVAAMAILGVTLGEALSALYLIVRSFFARTRERTPVLNDSMRSWKELVKTLLMLAIPVTVSNSVMSLTNLIDLGLVMNRLQDAGMSQTAATELYGIYNTMPVALFGLPQTLITALAVSILPAVAGACAAQNFTKASKTIGTSLRLGMLIALPAGVGLGALAGPILRLLYRQDTVAATPMLQILSIAVPFVAAVALTNSILQGLGRADLSLIAMFAGALVKLIAEYQLLGDPNVQILGAPVSTVLCYLAVVFINIFNIGRLSGALPSFGKTVGRPFAAAVGMGAAAMICFNGLSASLSAAPASLADKGITLISIVAAVAVYGILLLALGAVQREDVLLLPGGVKIADILHLK